MRLSFNIYPSIPSRQKTALEHLMLYLKRDESLTYTIGETLTCTIGESLTPFEVILLPKLTGK